MVKIFVKGNFLVLIDADNHFFVDNLENCLLSKDSDSAISYNIIMRGHNRPFVGIAFADIEDENGDEYASQSVFEEYIYENTGIRVASTGSGTTNLGYTASSTNGIVTSDTGADATIPLADGTNAGLLTPAEKTKLSNTSGTNSGDQDLSGLVPYLGATTDVDLGLNSLEADSIAIGIAPNGEKFHIYSGANPLRSILDADNNQARILSFRTTDIKRWAFRVDGNETGSNSGADFAIRRYNDAGTFIDAPISINRATGNITTSQDFNGASPTEIGYLSGVTSNIQTQFDAIVPSAIPTLKGIEVFRGATYRNNSTTEDTYGGITITTTGSTSAQSVATTSFATKQIRKRFFASVVSSGRYTGTRGSALLWYIGGGFMYACEVFISDQAYASGCRQFYGMYSATTDLTYSDVTTVASQLNIIGVGSDTDTNLQIFHNDGSGTATKVDLGASFPANRSAGSAMTNTYTMFIYNAPNTTQVVVFVIDNENGTRSENTITTDLPATTQGLNFTASRCMGGGGGLTNSGQFDLIRLGVYSL